ncbi:MAG: cytochrome P450 [Pseudomonadota bacterium]
MRDGTLAPTANAAMLREIPGDGGLPLLGYTLAYMRDPHALAAARVARHGEVSWMNAFGKRFVSLGSADGVQFVFQNQGDLFASDAWEYFLARFFHRGLMLLDFDEHRLHRRVMLAAFRKDALARYLEMMAVEIDHALARWPVGEQFEAFTHFKQLTLDLGSRVFVGEPPGAEAEALNRAFFDTVQAPTSPIRFGLPGSRWARGLKGRKLLETFFRSRIPAKRREGGSDLFAELCAAKDEAGERFSDDDVVNHMIFLLMAAHDTSTITLTNMVYHLAKHPEWQARLRAEAATLPVAEVTPETLERLVRMDWVMKEALRLTPPVPFIPRRSTREASFKGFRIPANSFVQIAPSYVHMQPEYWTDPTRFDPERFAPERREDRSHPFAWVPFGGGAHKCIGLFFGMMEVKAILHRMLLAFEWSVPTGYVIPMDHTSLPVPKDKLPIQLRRLAPPASR